MTSIYDVKYVSRFEGYLLTTIDVRKKSGNSNQSFYSCLYYLSKYSSDSLGIIASNDACV
jgi:hypothetical protein